MAKAKLPADDLFEQSSMSFGEHLDELRKAMTKAFLWWGIGSAIGLLFANSIVSFVETPLRDAITDFYVLRAQEEFKDANGAEPSKKLAAWIVKNEMMPERVFIDPATLRQPPEFDLQEEPESSEVAESAESTDVAEVEVDTTAAQSTKTESETETETADAELSAAEREALKLTASEVNPWNGIDIEQLMRLEPLLLWRPIPNKLVSLTATEPFMMWLKAGLVAGAVIASPGIFWHIWQFFAAGLYPHERRYVYWYLPMSLTLFFAGVCLAFFVVFRLVLGFLMTYTTGLNVEFTPRLNDYMTFALFLPLGFGIAFQLPIVMLGLHRFGVISVETFVSQWRMAVLTIAFLSMLLTPAEIYSMIGLFVPLVGLYFLGIALCKYMPTGAGIGSPAVDPQ